MSTKNNHISDFDAVVGRLMLVSGKSKEFEVAEILGLSKTAFATRKLRGSLPEKEIKITCAENKWSAEWVLTGIGPAPLLGSGLSGRVKTVRIMRQASQIEFAKSLGIKQPTLSDIENGAYPPSDSVKRLIVSQYRINEEWLETGEGEISEPGFLYSDSEDTYQGSTDTCQTVDIFNMVDGGAGAEPEWHEPIDRRTIPTGFLGPNIRPVLVRGRSMEPTFKNGAIIGIDQADKQVIEGEAYAIVLPYSGAAVKRLYPQPDGVLIRSDNKEFPEVKLKKEDVPEYFILGRVCWVVQQV